MSKKYDENIWKIKTSRYYCFVMAFSLTLTSYVIFIISLPWLLKLSLWLLANTYIAYIIWRHVLMRGDQSIIALAKKEDSWLLQTRTGEMTGALRGDSTVTQLVCILRFDCNQRSCQSLVIFRDALLADDYRRLLITLSLRSAV